MSVKLKAGKILLISTSTDGIVPLLCVFFLTAKRLYAEKQIRLVK